MNIKDKPFLSLTTLSRQETATLLAALRYWQRHQADSVGRSANPLPEDEIATDNGTIEPMRRREIEPLCAKFIKPLSCGRAADEVSEGRLAAPNGRLIVGTVETIPGVSMVDLARRQTDGLLDTDHNGGTTVYWDDQRTDLICGERRFVDEAGRYWRESDLHLVRAS